MSSITKRRNDRITWSNKTKISSEFRITGKISSWNQNRYIDIGFFYSFYFHYEKGHTGFLGLGGSGTDAPVFIQFYDSNDQKSEIFQLKQSTRHINKFERNQTGWTTNYRK